MSQQAHPKILVLKLAQLCSTEEVTTVPRNREEGGMGRAEEEHLGPLPAGFTLSASGQAARAQEKKAKSRACFQESELLPALRRWSQGSCLPLQVSSRTGTT